MGDALSCNQMDPNGLSIALTKNKQSMEFHISMLYVHKC